MSEDENKALHLRYAEEVNRGFDAWRDFGDEYFGPGYVFHGSQGDLNRDGFVDNFVSAMFAAFPDTNMTIDDTVAEGDRVVSRFTVRGTHRGEFEGIAPTGKQVTLSGIVLSRIEGGRVVEDWEELNMLGLMQQIGAIPAPAEA
jgi:predicted ester cyclase